MVDHKKNSKVNFFIQPKKTNINLKYSNFKILYKDLKKSRCRTKRIGIQLNGNEKFSNQSSFTYKTDIRDIKTNSH